MSLPAFWTDPWRTHPTAGKEIDHIVNPSFQLPASGLAALWTQDDHLAVNDFANSQVAGEQRVQLAGAVGDAGVEVWPLISNQSVSGTAAPGDIWSGTISVHGSAVGCVVVAYLSYYGATGLISASAPVTITLGGTLTMHAVTGAAAPAGTNRVQLMVKATDVHSGDTLDLYAANATLMKIAVPLPVYPDPNLPGTHWNGEWRNSTSTKELCYPVDGKFVLEDTSNARGTNIFSPAIAQAVTPGKAFIASALVEVLARVGGTLHCDLAFYTIDNSLISGYTIQDLSAAAAETRYSLTMVAPANAAVARLHFAWAEATGNCKATIRGAYLNPALPGVFSLAPKSGQYAAPQDLLLDAGTLALAGCYVGHTDDETAVIGDFVKPLAAAAWSAGAAAADAAGYLNGAGNTCWRHIAAAYTDVDVPNLAPGEYLVLANCKGTSADTDTVQHEFGLPILIPTTSLKLLSLGTVSLPTGAVRGAGVSKLRITITGNGGSEYAYINYVAFLPVSHGVIGYVLSSGHFHALRWEDGTLYVTGLVDSSEIVEAVESSHAFGGAAPLRALGGVFVVLAEQATAAPTTIALLTATVQPRWEQFPSA